LAGYWSGDTAILLQRVMPLAKILEGLEAASFKPQAASLTIKNKGL